MPDAFGNDFPSFIQRVQDDGLVRELEDMVWFDLMRLACLSSLEISSEEVSQEAALLCDRVTLDDNLRERCLGEIVEQESQKTKQMTLRRLILDAFKELCAPRCEYSILRLLLTSLDIILHEYETEAPFYVSYTDDLDYITYPDVPFPYTGPPTKYFALFDERPCFDKFWQAVL